MSVRTAAVGVALFLFHMWGTALAGDVIVLRDDNFQESISSGVWLVEFYAPWCGHCQKLAPVWEEVATRLKGRVHVAKIDCTEETKTKERFGIRGFPTVKLFAANGDAMYDYSKPRTLDNFVSFALEDYKALSPVPPPPPPAAPASPTRDMDGDVILLNAANIDGALATGTWLVYFFAPWCGHCTVLQPVWSELATLMKQSHPHIHVAKIDATMYQGVLETFAISGFPDIRLIADGAMYKYQGARTIESFLEFSAGGQYKQTAASAVPRVGAGSGTGSLASASSSGSSEGSDVVVLDSESFEKRTASGRWLIEFYAPWCGHCKALQPVWEKLASDVRRSHPDVRVAKVDCTIHRDLSRRFGIRGYPTIKLLENGIVYDFSGQRSLQSFVEFLDTYKSSPSSHLAAPPGHITMLIEDLAFAAESMLSQRPVLLLGLLFVMMLVMCVSILILCVPAAAPVHGPHGAEGPAVARGGGGGGGGGVDPRPHLD